MPRLQRDKLMTEDDMNHLPLNESVINFARDLKFAVR